MHNQESAHLTAKMSRAPSQEREEVSAPPMPMESFWHDRLVEAGLILSMGLYYLVGNTHLGAGNVLHVPPYLYSLPFLMVFAILSWYRLSFSVALMPLALPYYLIQKTVFSHGSHSYDFSLAEISLAVLALIALGQLLLQGKRWRYHLSWQDLHARFGPFALPILVFVAAALVSILVAVARQAALRAFREEIIDPFIYLLLVLCCLRTSQDLKRLLGAFLGSAMLVAVIGLVQYLFFANQLQQSLGGGRVLAVYGSANSIGLFFDYVLPIGMALLIFQVSQTLKGRGKWWLCVLILAGFVPLVGVLILSQSLGTALALPVALLFILALSIRQRKTLLIGTGILVLLALLVGVLLHRQLTHFITNWHDNSKGISTFTKRYYLWQVARDMIGSHPWFGVGLDNWLCYYTVNNVCPTTAAMPHFIIVFIPGTHISTGLVDEPTLSHPHEIFLQIWVSMGIFGLLAFLAILALFYWLFARIMRTVRQSSQPEIISLEWIVLGVGGAMLAVLCQGLVDNSFLEQDLAFCFWTLIGTLFILCILTETSWRKKAMEL
jgi:putative inorganic carbon (hco3(-)) transporter